MRGGILSKVKATAIVLYKLHTEGRLASIKLHPVARGIDGQIWRRYEEF